MEYICQIINGNMLVRDSNGDFRFEYTGYPYPDTPKSNAEMIKDLIYKNTGISRDLEFYQANFVKLRDYLLNCRRERYAITINGMLGALNIFDKSLFTNSCIYQFIESDNYVGLLVDKVSDGRFERADMAILFMSNDVLKKYNAHIRFDYKVIDEVRHMFRKTDLCGEIFNDTDLFNEFLKVCIKLVIRFGHSYLRVDYSVDSLSDLVHSVLSDVSVLTEYMRDVIHELLITYFAEACNVDYTVSQLSQILNISSCNVKTYLSSLEVYDIITLLTYVTKVNCSKYIEPNKPETVLARYSTSILNKLYSAIMDNMIFDSQVNMFISDLSKRGNREEWKIDELYEEVSLFRELISGFVYDLEPSRVTSNRVEWDMSKYFDSDLACIVPIVYSRFGCGAETYAKIGSLDNKKILELLSGAYSDIDEKTLIFDKARYDDLSRRFTEYKDDKYFVALPRDVMKQFGDIGLFGRLFCCDNNSSRFKCKAEDFLYNKDFKYVYQLGFAYTDMRLKITKEMFEKYVKGAVLIDFIKYLHSMVMSWDKSIRFRISLKNIKVFFFTKRQYVKLVYTFDSKEDSVI